jgi:Tol biopolymer transport system component
MWAGWEFGRPWSAAVRMTFTPAMDWYPVWTPDGRGLIFGSWRGGGFSNFYVQELESATAHFWRRTPKLTRIDGSGR